MTRPGSRDGASPQASPLLSMNVPRGETDWWRRARAGLARRMAVDLGSSPARTLFLAGSPRSGTTWLAEIINHDNRYRTIFEPFRPARVTLTRNFRSRQYLRPGTDDPALTVPIDRILAGRIRDPWTDQHNTRLLANRRLVKDPWSSLMLGWMSQRYPLMPMVLVIRHPCAVVSSQLAMGAWKWHVDLEDVLSQGSLVEDHLAPHLDAVRAAETVFERHVVLWCIENLVALSHLEGRRAHVVFYEDLCLDPIPQLERLFAFVGMPFDPAAGPDMLRPSALTRTDSAIAKGEGLVDGWRRHVDPGDVRRAADLVAAFGLDTIYGEGPLPVGRVVAAGDLNTAGAAGPASGPKGG